MKLIHLVCGILVTAAVAAYSTSPVRANTEIKDLLKEGLPSYKYDHPTFGICNQAGVKCEEVARARPFALVRYNPGEKCPAGYYYLLDDVTLRVITLYTDTCDPRFSITLDANTNLIFQKDGEAFGKIPARKMVK